MVEGAAGAAGRRTDWKGSQPARPGARTVANTAWCVLCPSLCPNSCPGCSRFAPASPGACPPRQGPGVTLAEGHSSRLPHTAPTPGRSAPAAGTASQCRPVPGPRAPGSQGHPLRVSAHAPHTTQTGRCDTLRTCAPAARSQMPVVKHVGPACLATSQPKKYTPLGPRVGLRGVPRASGCKLPVRRRPAGRVCAWALQRRRARLTSSRTTSSGPGASNRLGDVPSRAAAVAARWDKGKTMPRAMPAVISFSANRFPSARLHSPTLNPSQECIRSGQSNPRLVRHGPRLRGAHEYLGLGWIR